MRRILLDIRETEYSSNYRRHWKKGITDKPSDFVFTLSLDLRGGENEE